MFTVRIPNPYGVDEHGNDSHRNFSASSIEDLAGEVRSFIMSEGYGASDIGSQFKVLENGNRIGMLRYNGSFKED